MSTPSRTHYVVRPDGTIRCPMGHAFTAGDLDLHPTTPHADPAPAPARPDAGDDYRSPAPALVLVVLAMATVVFGILAVIEAGRGALLNGWVLPALVSVGLVLRVIWVMDRTEQARETRR